MSEENQNTDLSNLEEQVEESPQDASEEVESNFQEVVEVPWEDIEPLTRLRSNAGELEEYISQTLIQMEKRKMTLMTRLSELERVVYKQAQDLRDSLPLNPDWSFELKLPESVGEKGYFIRKEED